MQIGLFVVLTGINSHHLFHRNRTHYCSDLCAFTVSCHSHVKQLIKKQLYCGEPIWYKKWKHCHYNIHELSHPSPPPFLFTSSLLSPSLFPLQCPAPSLLTWLPEVADRDCSVSSPQHLNTEKVDFLCWYGPYFNCQDYIHAPVF